MILNYCGYLTLLPTIFTCRHKESNKHQNLIKTNKRNSMKNMVISSAPLYYYILIKKKNLWLLTCNDISRKKNLRETDRKRGEKSETTITQCQKDSEVIVLQRMSSFPTCSVKYLPNYLLILTRRSLLIIWPDQHYYHFYELPLLLARWGLISDFRKVILILYSVRMPKLLESLVL